VLDFAGADAESQRAESAVRGSVAVAADDGLAGLSDAELRADDVHDALMLAVHVEEADAGFAAVLFEGIELGFGIGVDDGESAIGGGDRVVHYGESEVGTADFAAFGAEAGESLGRRAFMNEMAVDVDERGFSRPGGQARLFVDEMVLPDFFVEGFWWHGLAQTDFSTPANGSKFVREAGLGSARAWRFLRFDRQGTRQARHPLPRFCVSVDCKGDEVLCFDRVVQVLQMRKLGLERFKPKEGWVLGKPGGTARLDSEFTSYNTTVQCLCKY